MTAKKKEPKGDHEHTTGKVCKKCGRPTFAGADGKLRHERRGITTKKDGERTGDTPPPSGDGQEDEEPPDRGHALSRTLWGGKKKDE